jgi:hypothetical protein
MSETVNDGYGTVANITRMTYACRENATRDGHSGEPWSPWSAQVMILAGLGYDGRPWLWLGCRNCGWFLGYSSQIDPDYLTGQAKAHREHCPEPTAPPSAFTEGPVTETKEG